MTHSTPQRLHLVQDAPGRQHNLPAPPNSFIGRASDLTEIAQRLRLARLVTLTGPAGVGKTRLALETGERLLHEFRDGVWLVQLQSVGDPTVVAQTVATVLGVRQRASDSVVEALCAALASRELLLVLDNCEHVVEQCASVVDVLLRACSDITVLTTSRERLQVPAEMVWPVRPLSLPDLAASLTVEQFVESEAGLLFVERARAAAPGFLPAPNSVALLSDICRRLDGLPLAIELAAVCVRTLSIVEIAARIGDRFHLLTHARNLTSERHRTLRQAIAWSYDLLNPQDQVVFRRLAVFVGGWTLQIAEKVCALEGSRIDIVSGLRQLVEKSLVEFDSEGRYRLLDSIREFAREQLEESGEAPAIRAGHAETFLTLAEAARKHLNGPTPGPWVEQLEADQGNFRAALQWCLDDRRPALGLVIASELALFWTIRGHLSEGELWLERVLRVGDPTVPDALRARALAHASALAIHRGDIARARNLQEQALELRRALGDKPGIGDSLLQLGSIAAAERDWLAARGHLEEAMETFRQLDDKLFMGLVSCNLGRVIASLGDYELATNLGEQSLSLVKECGATRWIPRVCVAFGHTLLRRGDIARSAELLRRGTVAAYDIGESWTLALGLELYAGLALSQGRPERATLLLGGAAALREHMEGVTPFGAPDAVAATASEARSVLGSARFRAAWARGRACRPDDLIEQLQGSLESETSASDSKSLTGRELEVARLLARGCTNRDVAAIAVSTTERHVANILNKLDLHTRTEIALWALEHGLATEGTPNSPD
jgi:predicted ATPase/DNA-binding CsgD family transcriptional regulator